jgi:hypothetical protein
MADVERPGAPDREVIDVTDATLGATTRVVPYAEPQVLPIRGHGVRPGHRGWYLGLGGAIASAVLVAVFLFATSTPPLTNLSAEVASDGEVSLSFPQSGILTRVMVHTGESVKPGQVIAQESVPGLSQDVTQYQATVSSDMQEEAYLRKLLSSQQGSFASDKTSLVSIFSQELTDSNNALAAAQAQQQAITNSTAGVVAQSQSALSLAQATEQTECAGVAGTGSVATPAVVDCLDAQGKVADAKVTLAQAQSTATVEGASASATVTQDQRLVAEAQAAYTSQLNANLPTYVSLQTDLTNVETQTEKDQAALYAYQSKASTQNLVAPISGKVTSLNGTLGAATGLSGSPTSAPAGNNIAVSPGFELFPSASSQSGSSATTAPVAVIQGPKRAVIDVLVPETQIGLVRVGATAVFNPAISGFAKLKGKVSQIFPRPSVAAGVVSYEVQVLIPRADSSYLDGVTGNVTISRGR